MSRDRATDEIRSRGGNVSGSVSRKTAYVILGKDAGAKKKEQARALNIPLLKEDAFLRVLGHGKREPSKRQTVQEDLFSR